MDETGLGGTEQSVVYLAKNIAKNISDSSNVIVTGDVVPGLYDNVRYVNQNSKEFIDIKQNMSIDVLIGVSYVHFCVEFEGSQVGKYVYWAHNTEPFWWYKGEELHHRVLDRIDEFVFLTDWHANDFNTRYQLKDSAIIHVIGNGIDTSIIKKSARKRRTSLYSSHAERGLSKVLNDGFLDDHQIKLYVCTPEYGKQYIEENFDTEGFNYMGSLSRTNLYDQMSKSMFWYYPTDYEETYCITALEMLAHGVIPVMEEPKSGLKETLRGFYATPDEVSTNSWSIDQEEVKKYVKSRDWVNVSKEWNTVLKQKEIELNSYVITIDLSEDLISRYNDLFTDNSLYIHKAVDGNNPVCDFDYSTYNWKIESENSWYNRPLKKGEVGCMLSHLTVLKEAYDSGQDYVLILEEDFKPLRKLDLKDLPDYNWDICFLGRNPVTDDEGIVDDKFVVPGYSYNTHAILYRRSGIEKILQGKPERYIMPWDEYLAATYCEHPRKDLDFIWTDVKAIAYRKDIVSQTSNSSNSSIENTDYVYDYSSLTDYSDWESWKKRWLSYEALTKEWDLIVDEPVTDVFSFPLFNEDFCKAVVDHANKMDNWQADRHDFYPTIDVLLEKIGLNEVYTRVLKEYGYACAIHMWQLEGKNWPNMKSENFMIKYTEEKQGHLSLHHDYSDISFVLALNEEYEGGGTYFHRQKKLHKGKTGHISLHPGAITHRHGGRPVHRGERYIVVSFCRFDR